MKYVVYYSPPDYQAKIILTWGDDINSSMGWLDEDKSVIEVLKLGQSAVIDDCIFVMRVE